MKRSRRIAWLEALAVGLAGAVVGFATGILAFGLLAVPGAVVAGLNGLLAGARGIYDWRSVRGWFAFASDSSWGLLGTATALVLNGLNLRRSDAGYKARLSRRRNRYVYEGGFALKPNLALTLGNVISNAGEGRREIVETFLDNHESLHIWQGRFLGPLFQLVYFVWFPIGVVVGLAAWLFDRRESLSALVETAAYYNNPLEYWAYRNDSCWPPRHAHPKLHWGRARRKVNPHPEPSSKSNVDS